MSTKPRKRVHFKLDEESDLLLGYLAFMDGSPRTATMRTLIRSACRSLCGGDLAEARKRARAIRDRAAGESGT